jgi:hypothetical protein
MAVVEDYLMRWCTCRCQDARASRVAGGLTVLSDAHHFVDRDLRDPAEVATTAGLILPYVALNLALSFLITRGVFEQISPELGRVPAGAHLLAAFAFTQRWYMRGLQKDALKY